MALRTRNQRSGPTRGRALVAMVGLLAVAPLFWLFGVGSASAQTAMCTVAASLRETQSTRTIVITFQSDPSIRFTQAPGWSYEMTRPDGELVALGQRPAGDVGPLEVPVPTRPGVFVIRVEADGAQTCATVIDVVEAPPTAAPLPTSESNLPAPTATVIASPEPSPVPTSVVAPVSEVENTERAWWLVLLLLLPFVAVASLFVGRWRWPGDSDGRARRRPTAQNPSPVLANRDLGIVLSGGGTRASAFSLGVVMAVLDQQQYGRVGQIGSVSGGSLTNGYLAGLRHTLGGDPTSADDVAPFAARIATRGLPLERSAQFFVGTSLAAVGWITWFMFGSGPSVLQGLATVGACLAYLVVSWVIYSWIGIRAAVSSWVHRFLGIGRKLTLGELGSSTAESGTDINHIFTSTAPGASHVHLSNRRSVIDPLPPAKAAKRPAVIETGSASSVPVAKAAQASAAFPGLPHVRLRAQDMGFSTVTGWLSLRDGGTVDNLGHIGATLDDSSPEGADYRRVLQEWNTIKRWIVVDSSAEVRSATPSRWRTRLLEFLHIGFAADLAEIAATGAANTTHARARQLTERFAADRSGLYLHLRQSPVDACLTAMGWHPAAPKAAFDDAEAASDSIFSGRGLPPEFGNDSSHLRTAAELLQMLHQAERGDTKANWAARTRRNGSVRTTLSSLGATRTADLMHHGYVLATVEAVLDFGWAIPTQESLSPDRFALLVG